MPDDGSGSDGALRGGHRRPPPQWPRPCGHCVRAPAMRRAACGVRQPDRAAAVRPGRSHGLSSDSSESSHDSSAASTASVRHTATQLKTQGSQYHIVIGSPNFTRNFIQLHRVRRPAASSAAGGKARRRGHATTAVLVTPAPATVARRLH